MGSFMVIAGYMMIGYCIGNVLYKKLKGGC